MKRDSAVRLGASPQRVFELSLSLSLLLVILAFRFFPSLPNAAKVRTVQQEIVKVEDVDITRQVDRPPPPPKPPIPIEAPPDEALDDVSIGSTELDVAQNVAPPPIQQLSDDDVDEEYFVAVEEMPQIVGGIEALMRNLEYPELAMRAGIQGRVYVLAFVDEKGNVTRVDLLKGIGGGCDEAAIAAVKKVKFIPGKQRGKAVKTRISIPVQFSLRTD